MVSGDGEDACVFCAVRDSRNRLNHVLVRRDGTVALLNLAMITPGHALVVPDRHVERLDELDFHEIAAVWDTVTRVREAIAAALEPDGFVYVQNEGEKYTTERHLHVHIVPRYPGDALRDMWEGERPPDHDELRRVEALLGPQL